LIEAEGAVSEAVARAMVLGLKERSGSDYCLAITGIAGPGGETPQKKVGLTYIALKTPENLLVRQFQFFGDRNTIRLRGALNALNMIRLEILKESIE
jgi:nicotinamide-nucleotide amidase